MNFVELIERKRDGRELATDEIRSLVDAAARGDVPDYQLSAWLMAVYFRGMSPAEVRDTTLAMRDSGRVLEWPEDPRPLVDKHSTGGVGDKVSLVLAPLLAALGFRVPMISGRGLGITGGTLDKLESIPGFGTDLTPEQIVSQVQDIGLAMAGQSASMVPADRNLYRLRDVTGTVPSIPLITASILSKKLAENLDALVMDVKFGAAAFMKTRDEARTLARSIVDLARECELPTTALLTTMDAPLGASAGNWLEVKEIVGCLKGYGPDDLQALVVEMAATLLVQTGRKKDHLQARQAVLEKLATDQPRRCFDQLVEAQGGDLAAFHRQLGLDSIAPVVRELTTPEEGFITRVDARILGEVVRDLGGGRTSAGGKVDPGVGLDRIAKPGEPFGVDSLLLRVHARNEADAEKALSRLRPAFEFSPDPFDPPPLIAETLV